MKKVHLFFIKGLFVAFACVMFVGCDEGSLEIPNYQFSRVSKCERDSVKTLMTYGSKGLSEYSLLVNDALVCKASVGYSSSKIFCTINGISYDIQLSNTKGGARTEGVLATVNGARLYNTQYWYDGAGRLIKACIEGVGPQPVYTHYKYEEGCVVIDDVGTEYRINLSLEDNLGYVCNVLDYADAPYTSNYVINPDLYFLNIYGTPVAQLPYGHEIERCNNNLNLSRVGKYSYEYHPE